MSSIEIMTGRILMNVPISPLIINSGRKAKIVVIVAASTAGNISTVPRIVASRRSNPSSI